MRRDGLTVSLGIVYSPLLTAEGDDYRTSSPTCATSPISGRRRRCRIRLSLRSRTS
ncbi:MAG: hypothetical protein U0521_17315 [Anaerolineae bacterium]